MPASPSTPLAALGTGWLPRIARVLEAYPATRPEPAKGRERLCRFLDLLVQWNQKMDLTAARHADELADLMLADAALLLSAGFTPGERWVDVGTGAGAPGIALAILAPELDFNLVEPRQKRIAFLRSAVSLLQCENVRVTRARSEEVPSESADVAVSRATLAPSEWLPEGARLATRAAWVLLAREPAPTLDGYQSDRDIEYTWPLTDASRRAVRFVQAP